MATTLARTATATTLNDGDDVERGEGGLRWRKRCASHGRMMVF